MPSIATGANAANGGLTYIGISGDGDSLSIGLGQLCHIIRRNVNMLYVLENNGVYGLTKGQFSASADRGSLAKRGEANQLEAIDGAMLAMTLGATFVARSFSGDKHQLVPILKAGLKHKGFAFVDVISPCVTFNDHEGSTKSYAFTRQHQHEVDAIDFVPLRKEIQIGEGAGTTPEVRLHDGSVIRFRRVDESYDPTDRDRAYAYLRDRQRAGEVVTGLLYVSENSLDLHDVNKSVATPLVDLPYEQLVPGAAALATLQKRYR
jgi:2-oxoglutarate ferredoxin oxidoreductase subunit beta